MADSSCRVPVSVADTHTKASLIKHLPFERESGQTTIYSPQAAAGAIKTRPRAATVPTRTRSNRISVRVVAPTEKMDFKCALVTGGAGGIGRALSEYFISKGVKVIIAGRTESKLQTTAKEIGAAAYYVLDTGSMGDIPAFVAKVTKEHPEIDCVVNNAGVQRPLKVLEASEGEGKDDDGGGVAGFLEKADAEINVNIRGPMHLGMHFVPHLRQKARDGGSACIMNVSSLLGFVPFSIINPVYNGTKAWVHFWTMNLRTQLAKDGDRAVRVVEIIPPMVESDLHREREDPDDNKKKNNDMAMTMDEFMKEVTQKLERGETTIAAGMANDGVKKWYEAFGGQYEGAAKQW